METERAVTNFVAVVVGIATLAAIAAGEMRFAALCAAGLAISVSTARLIARWEPRERSAATSAAGATPPTGLAATQETKGKNMKGFVMRGLGYIFTPLAGIMWVATVIVTAIMIFWPESRTTTMPLVPGYTGSVYQFFRDYAFQMGLVLVILNGLSGRWGPTKWRRIDLLGTRFGLIASAVMFGAFVLIGLLGKWIPAEAWDFWFLAGLAGFAWYDYMVHQGEDWRSSTLLAQEQGKRLTGFFKDRAVAGGMPVRQSPSAEAESDVPHRGPLWPYVQMGLTRIELPNERVVVEIDQVGDTDYDLPDLNLPRLTALAAAELAPKAPASPGGTP